MFGKRKEPDAKQAPAHGRYYLQRVEDSWRQSKDEYLTGFQTALDAGSAEGWELVQAEFDNNAPALLLWDTRPQ